MGLVKMSCRRNVAKATMEMIVPTLEMSLANLPSCMLRGVFTCVRSVDRCATLPISVASPTAVTTATPWPFMTMVERRMTLGGYASLPPVVSLRLLVASGSPVRLDSSTCRLVASTSWASAGISSPTSTRMRSPTTMSRLRTSVTWPSRRTFTIWSSFMAVRTLKRRAASHSK